MTTEPVDVCIIDDNAAERKLLMRRFLRLGYSVIEAVDGNDGLRAVRQRAPRVLICDLMMPGMSGVDMLRALRVDPDHAGAYVIILTAYGSQQRKREALNAGADDYLIKPYDMDELEAKVRNGLRVCRLQEHLRRAALTDSLTELWNHSQFREHLAREFARTRRYGGAVSLIMLDIDHFKAINDTYGHEVGNRVLQATAEHLRNTVRDSDVVSRYGGEEFSVTCPQTTLDAATHLAERVRKTLPDAIYAAKIKDLSVTASLGVSCSSDAGVVTPEELISSADQAMYVAKRNGRNQVQRCDAAITSLDSEVSVAGDELERLRKQVAQLSLQAKELCLQSIWALVQALEQRDVYTVRHSQNVRWYVSRLANAAGWPENMRTAVDNAATLHDLGKIGLPDAILQKAGPLTAQEAAQLRRAPLLTCKILEPLRVFETESVIIRHLRERYDGAGFPEGRVGLDIPLGSRLLAIAEAFDALTTERVYRAPRDVDDALAAIRAEAAQHFDPAFVELLSRVVEQERDAWEARVNETRSVIADLTDGPTLTTVDETPLAAEHARSLEAQ